MLCTEEINEVLKKIVQVPGGLDESSLLYVGHWILSLVINCKKVIKPETLQGLLLCLQSRMAKANMPSTCKVNIY